MTLLIKTRKLPATQTHSEQMRASTPGGTTLTIPFPYGSLDPGEHVAQQLARAMGYAPVVERVSGQTYRTTTDVMIAEQVAQVIYDGIECNHPYPGDDHDRCGRCEATARMIAAKLV